MCDLPLGVETQKNDFNRSLLVMSSATVSKLKLSTVFGIAKLIPNLSKIKHSLSSMSTVKRLCKIFFKCSTVSEK